MSTIPIMRMDQHGLLDLRELLARAIAEIVEVHPGELQKLPVYRQYSQWLLDLSARASVAVVTSNYDMVAEYPVLMDLWGRYLGERKVYDKLDFGFGWRGHLDGAIQRRPRSSRISFFKLHGVGVRQRHLTRVS
jgi:hypothetical protein